MEQSARRAAERTHYAWESPSHEIAILLNLRLVDRLQQLLRESPEREIGGLLVGNCDDPKGASGRRVVLVEDFEAVPSQHVRGTAYTLSSQDLRGLLRSVSKLHRKTGRVPVGLFRSHLRKGLYLDEADFSLFQSHFSGPCDVFLLARPEVSGIPIAGFFSWEDESLNRRNSYVTFPLDRSALAAGAYTLVSAPDETPADPVQTPVVTPAAGSATRPATRSATRPVTRWMYGAAGAMMILTALVMAFLMRFPGSGTAGSSRDVELSVRRDGGALQLKWNGNAAPVTEANRGTLWISDAGQQRRVDLNPELLKQGSFLYTPQSADVNFRLDLMNVEEQHSESVRFVGDRPTTVAVAATPQQTIVTAAPPPRKRVYNEDEDGDGADRDVPKPRQFAPAPAPQTNAPPTTVEQTRSIPAPAQQQPPAAVQAEPVRPTRTRVEPTVTITTEAITPQRLRDRLRPDWMSKVLHIGRNKEGEHFIPPQATHKVSPHVPLHLAREMAAETRLEFKVSIDKRGNVDDLVLVSRNDPRLADVAAAAVNQWRFEPAQLKDKAVASDMMVIMHFHNPLEGTVASK